MTRPTSRVVVRGRDWAQIVWVSVRTTAGANSSKTVDRLITRYPNSFPFSGWLLDSVIVEACGRNSGVECQLPKLDVTGSNPVARSDVRHEEGDPQRRLVPFFLLRGNAPRDF